jgi:hypothetical protein
MLGRLLSTAASTLNPAAYSGRSNGTPLESVTEVRPEYAAGFRVDAAVLKSRPSMVNENRETRREQVVTPREFDRPVFFSLHPQVPVLCGFPCSHSPCLADS